MKLASYPGLQDLRLDHDLRACDELIAFYLDSARTQGAGKKIVAQGPLVPAEVTLAAGALPYDITTREPLLQSVLNGPTSLHHQAVEAGMSPELSPGNLIMLGAALRGQTSLPADMYATMCGGCDDQLTKGFQVLAQAGGRPLRFWEVPRYDPAAEGWALAYLTKELEQLFEWFRIHTGQKTTAASLGQAIRQGNQLRADVAELHAYLALPRPPLAALEYYLVQLTLGDWAQDPAGLHQRLQGLLAELKARAAQGQGAPGVAAKPIRVYLLGDETLELSLFNAVENYGGCVVGCDFRFPLYYEPIGEQGAPLAALARWVWRMPHNLTTAGRVQAELEAIKKQQPQAVVISSTVGSRRLPGTERLVRDLIREGLGVPTLSVETGLPRENAEKVDYQIRAFLEVMA